VQNTSSSQLIEEIEVEMQKVKTEISNPTFSASNLYLSQLQHRLSTLNYQTSIAEIPGQTNNTDELDARKKETHQVIEEYKKALDARIELKEVAMMTPLEYYQSLEKELAETRKIQRNSIATVSAFKQKISENKKKMISFLGNTRQITSFERTISLTTDLYTNLKKKLLEAQVQEASTLNDVSVISRPIAPVEPASLSIKIRAALALLLSLLISVAIIVLKESLLSIVRDRFDLIKMGLPVIAEIPAIDAGTSVKDVTPFWQRWKSKEKKSQSHLLILKDHSSSRASDTIRTLRLKLHNAQKKQTQGQVILMTSADSQVGKSFLSANLAYAFAGSGAKTLLIDGNLRKPDLHNFFEEAKVFNFSEVDRDFENLDKKTINPTNNLDVLTPAQVANPMDYLDSKWLGSFLDHLKNKYQVILIDAPSTLEYVDSTLISAHADQVCLLTQLRHTHREDVQNGIDRLREIYTGPIYGIINCTEIETLGEKQTPYLTKDIKKAS
jgi:polysaccharide biosynthesis transport protein